MAEKERDSNPWTGQIRPSIKEPLTRPTSFDIRRFRGNANGPNVGFSKTNGGSGICKEDQIMTDHGGHPDDTSTIVERNLTEANEKSNRTIPSAAVDRTKREIKPTENNVTESDDHNNVDGSVDRCVADAQEHGIETTQMAERLTTYISSVRNNGEFDKMNLNSNEDKKDTNDQKVRDSHDLGKRDEIIHGSGNATCLPSESVSQELQNDDKTSHGKTERMTKDNVHSVSDNASGLQTHLATDEQSKEEDTNSAPRSFKQATDSAQNKAKIQDTGQDNFNNVKERNSLEREDWAPNKLSDCQSHMHFAGINNKTKGDIQRTKPITKKFSNLTKGSVPENHDEVTQLQTGVVNQQLVRGARGAKQGRDFKADEEQNNNARNADRLQEENVGIKHSTVARGDKVPNIQVRESLTCKEEWIYMRSKAFISVAPDFEEKFNVSIVMDDGRKQLILQGNPIDVTQASLALEREVSSWKRVLLNTPAKYVWKFAFSCRPILERIDCISRQTLCDIELYQHLFFRSKADVILLTEGKIQMIMTACVEDLAFTVFTIHQECKEDVTVDIDQLNKRPATHRRPNPYLENQASVYFDMDDNSGNCRLVLVALTQIFEKCKHDIEEIILRNEALKDGESKNVGNPFGEQETETKKEEAWKPQIDRTADSQRNTGMPKETTVTVNIDKWKVDWLFKTKGELKELETSFCVSLKFSDGRLHIAGDKLELDQFKQYLKENTRNLTKEVRSVDTVVHQNMQEGNQIVRAFEQKYEVAVECSRILDQQSDVQLQLEGVTIVLARHVTYEQSRRITLRDSTHGIEFIVGNRNFPSTYMKAAVQEILHSCTEYTCTVSIDDYQGQLSTLRRVLQDFVKCLVESRKGKDEFQVYLFTDRTKLFFCVKAMLERFEQPNLDNDHGGPLSFDIQVVQGELAKQKVDVIVNSSNENLNLTEGVVSKSLVKVAGNGMQQEASMNYPRGIKTGELAETKGYGLQAAKVIHTCLFGWNYFVPESQAICRQLLRTIITGCLQRTEELRLRSIAFPALGTGVLKYPNDVAASEMIKAAKQYQRDTPNTCIRNVVFVIYTSEIKQLKAFKDKLNDLDEQTSGTQQALTGIDTMEYCAVISGRKEDVAKAVANFDKEIATVFKYLSGKSKETEMTGPHMNIRPEEPNHLHTDEACNRTPHYRNQTLHNKQHGKHERGNEEDQASDGTPHACDNKGPGRYENVIDDARKRMTADKGAIPKTSKDPKGMSKTCNDADENSSSERTKTKVREKDIKQQSDEKDHAVDEILDMYLTNITVTLKKDVVEVLQKQNTNGLSQKLKKHYKVELDTENLSLRGSAKDIALASDEIIKAMQVVTPECDETKETDESENSDMEGDSYDSLEQTLFEQTLSLRSITRVDESEKLSLMKIRPEVLRLCKIIHRDLWNSISDYSSERLDHNTVTVEIRNVRGMEECFYSFKEALASLDQFQFIELDSRFAVDDILECVEDFKKANAMFDKVYVLELSDNVSLAGEIYEQLDELRGLIGHKVMKGQQKPRTHRQLSDVSGIDRITSDMHIDNHFATNDKSEESRNKFDTRKVPGCRQFQTNEGIRVYVYKASILKLEVDCIVNAANSKLEHGGGIAKVIAESAGQALYRESREIIQSSGPLFVGTCCVTSAGRLPYKRVIHTVGPCRSDYRKHETAKMQEDLYNAFYSTLEELKHLQYTSIGIPSVSSGVFGVPKKLCALQFCLAVEDFSRNDPYSSVQEVHFIDVDEEMLTVMTLTCDIVFNNSAQAEKKLRTIFPKQNLNLKAKVRELMHTQKNKRHRSFQQSKLKTELDIQISEGFRVLVVWGDITTFNGNVVVCGQDKLLQCNSGVARALIKVDRWYYGNLKSRYNKVPYHEGDVLEYRSRHLSYDVYNVVVPKGDFDLQTLSFCYSQVLDKADLKPAGKMAVPIFISGSNINDISQVGRMLAGLFIEMINAKGSHYKFPDVYIYDKDKQRVNVLAEAMADILIERGTGNYAYPQGQWSPKQSNTGSRLRKVFKQRPTIKGSQEELSGRNRTREKTDKTRQGRVTQPFSDQPTEDETRKTEIYEKSTKKTFEHDDANSDKPVNSTKDTETSRTESLKCVICMDSLDKPKTLTKCGHTFCTDCIDSYFNVKPVCPTCSMPYGILTGTQPNGQMKCHNDAYVRLPGYERCGAIKIVYTFNDGIQGEEHPNPGHPYTGTRRTAYLPDNERGRKVCKMLELAFNRRLVFTIGRSVTTGTEDTVTWNDIHHKTNVYGGPARYGYPDPDYLNRVTEELAIKGVTEADI